MFVLKEKNTLQDFITFKIDKLEKRLKDTAEKLETLFNFLELKQKMTSFWAMMYTDKSSACMIMSILIL